ncbi:M20/M25/M40 family metallo-hydrolase [Bradyrhizobium sp. SRS-191]|uniref:M20/M25/M40 family metallo-hydrolase n=1 Tax=Bradyrhizobium sp. SRS-191 TaxID=2962606 RepID=UPI00211F1555|nr:M20/M25/M40 family metallo-hydrolase [Bradyrhizobium sp. SRS-191]
MSVDTAAATDRLMRLLAVPGVTGQEKAIGREIMAALKQAGVPAKAMRLDDANTRIALPTETGNLIVELPGRGTMKDQPRLMFMTHMDTVPLCAGAQPTISGRKIVNQAKTALGGDNRCGCGILVSLAAELVRQKLDHPPITLLFCVREESGLHGARHVDLDALGAPAMAFNFDGSSASSITIAAVGADKWEVEIFGRASHAGVAPERGISSTMMLALALAEVKAGGWFGKVVKGKGKDAKLGTSNVGPVTGGEGRPAGDATNVVTDYIHVTGECRSHDAKFVREISNAYKAAFEKAAKQVVNSDGKSGRVKFKAVTEFPPFRMKETLPVVKRATAAVSDIGATPTLRAGNGGLDANWMVRHGIPTVTFGTGQNEPHTIDEWINLDEYDRACALAVRLATMG